MTNVKSIYDKENAYNAYFIRKWLEDHEYEGLVNGETECGCGFDNFCCGDGCPSGDCQPAYKHADGLFYAEEETP